MGAGADAHLGRKRPNGGVITAVGAHPFQNAAAHRLLDDVFYGRPHLFHINFGVLRLQFGQNALAQFAHCLAPFLPFHFGRDGFDLCPITGGHKPCNSGIGHTNDGFGLGFANLGAHLYLHLQIGLDGLVAKLERIHHDGFDDFVGSCLDHDDGFFGACQTQIQGAFFHLFDGGVGHKLAINKAHPHGADGAVPRNVGDH